MSRRRGGRGARYSLTGKLDEPHRDPLGFEAFLEKGDYPPYWSSESSSERASMEKGLDMCKAAVVKAVVEVAGEQNELWDDSNLEKPGGEFVDTMVRWIRSHGNLKDRHRDDLIICATLSLGNLATGGK